MNRTIFVSATRANTKDDTILGQAFWEQCVRTGRTAELWMKEKNKDKLSVFYNQYITPEYRDCNIVFVHDDVHLDVQSTLYGVEDALKDHDIVGLAGCTNATIKEPALWHLMAPRNCLSGAVAHPIAKHEKQVFMTSFGAYPQRCLIMDGLFLGIKVNSLLDKKVKFDEQNPCISHFYDLDFCLSANKAGLKMTTWPIYVTHRSLGLTNPNDASWKEGQKWFLKKWAE